MIYQLTTDMQEKKQKLTLVSENVHDLLHMGIVGGTLARLRIPSKLYGKVKSDEARLTVALDDILAALVGDVLKQ